MSRGTWGGTLDPSIFKVNLRFKLGSSFCQTGFKLRDVGTKDNSAQDVADEVATQLEAPFKTLLKPTDSLEGIDVIKLGSEEGGWHPFSPSVGLFSFTDAEELPHFMCANIALKSEIRKRYGQGRMFLPLVADALVDGNILTTGGVSRMNIFLTPLQDHFTGDPVTHDLLLVNAHPALPQRAAPGAPDYRPAIPATWYDVVSVRINNVATFLRSRKVGVGS